MNNQILITLKRKLDDIFSYGTVDAETQRNALKEELQFYVLNFIYHHPDYSNWTMYGGSALRICHGLDRMSVDLDFEVAHAITEKFLEELKKETEDHFTNTYGASKDFLTVKITNGRGLLLRFHIGEELGIGHPSKQVHVKIDLNHFTALKTVIERRPINRDQLSFVIKTYNMSVLMASKIAAIFLRGQRGVDKAVYEEKGRDIYDLLWYMTKETVPDLDYLIAKGVDVKDPRALFDKLTLQMNKVNDTNLKQDLSPLFMNQTFIENWLKNWRESYFHLLDGYKTRTVTVLREIIVDEDFHTDNFSFIYLYDTAEGEIVRITYVVAYEWITFGKVLGITVDEDVVELATIKPRKELSDQTKQFITLFHKKTEAYFKKMNRIMIGNAISTKLIGTTTGKSVLLSCRLEDLFK